MTQLEYIKVGDYLYPNLTIPEKFCPPEGSIGKYGEMRRTYLKEHNSARYSLLILKLELWNHLAAIEKEAQEKYRLLMEQLQRQYPAPSKDDTLNWVRHQNRLSQMADEQICEELIYV